jgi:hypothetical protein
MAMLTKELIFSYMFGGVTDPDLCQQIEYAREYDPLVQYWFDLFSPTGLERPSKEWLHRAEMQMVSEDELSGVPSWRVRMFKTARGYRSKHRIEYRSRGDTRMHKLKPPTPDEPTYHEHDTIVQVMRFTYPAAEVPLGVARVTRMEGDNPKESVLVAFRDWGMGENKSRQAVVPFADLGIPADSDSMPDVYVEFAATDNLEKFPLDELRKLRERCNGDRELRRSVDVLLAKFSGGTK